MLGKLKESFLLRSLLYHVLKHTDTSRRISSGNSRLYFNAGTNFNLFFRKNALIEPGITSNIGYLIKERFIVYDIGANIGYYTILFSQLAKEGKVVAFEPDPVNFEYLLKNKKLNNLTNVTLVNNGVSSEMREFEFYQDITTGRTSSVETDAWHPNATKINKLTISTTTLNEAYKIYGKPDLIKCDVEGHEVEVLRGASNVLINQPVLILEVKDDNREQVARILLDYDYRFLNAELPIKDSAEPKTIIEFTNVLCINKDYMLHA